MNQKFLDNLWYPFSESTEFINLYEEALEKANTNQHDNIRKRYRFFSLFQLVYLSLKNNKNFHFAECGCFKGHSSYIISSILKKQQFNNKFFIFDSFEGGLSTFSKEDKQVMGRLVSTEEEIIKRNKFANNFDSYVKLMNTFDFIEIQKSWIPDDFHKIQDFQFQFVHIDVDLYQPTIDCLNFFYPRLVKGGIIICDDYNFLDFPGAKLAWDEYFKNKNFNFTYEVPLGSKFLIK